jgi:metal-responsive CopG/Arc/MetJ family transcriptional regulator
MASIRTAVSIQQTLFEQLENLAHEMKISRSRLFALALEDFIRRNQNRQLLEEINQAYQEYPADENEQLHLSKMRSQHRKLVMGEW